MAGLNHLVIITHVDHADTAWIEEWAGEQGVTAHVVRPFAGEALPPLTGDTAVCILGGPVSAYDDLDYIAAEIDYVREAVAAGNRVLGICLGAQILTIAMGGTVAPGRSGPECGVIEVGAADARLAPILGGRFFSFHGDEMVPPPNADLLAESDRYAQAWTQGNALALQFHPEMSPEGARRLLVIEEEAVAARGLDPQALLSEFESLAPQGQDRMAGIATWWFKS